MQKYAASKTRAFFLMYLANVIGIFLSALLITSIEGDFPLTVFFGGSIGALLGVGVGVIATDKSIVITEDTLTGPNFGWKRVTLRWCDLNRASLRQRSFWVRLNGAHQVVADNGQRICISRTFFSKQQVETILTDIDHRIALLEKAEVVKGYPAMT